MPYPVVAPAVRLAAVEGGYLAFDAQAGRLHRLNPLGALLVELCDGARSVEDIRALAAPLLPGAQAGEVDRWLAQAVRAGLLAWGEGRAAPPRFVPESGLPDLAASLRRAGEYEAAYLCRKRYAELQPRDAGNWYVLARVAQWAGHRGEAAEACARYLDLRPDDAEIRHLLVALRGGTPPPRCSDGCVREIFDSFAESFDSRLLEDLDYQAPQRLRELVDAAPGTDRLDILDLGCGTGLSGAALRHRAARLVGVDLSPEMVARAQTLGIYDALEVAEITEWLGREGQDFGLVAACDCLVYFGDLLELTRAVARRLRPGGRFAFTLERGEGHPFRLMPTGRYAHHPEHVRQTAAAAGLAVERLGQGFLRMEFGEEVTGLLVLLAKPG